VLIKLCQNEQTDDWAQSWSFQLRVCDLTGGGLHGADTTARAAADGSTEEVLLP
jgi:hypothetical protein